MRHRHTHAHAHAHAHTHTHTHTLWQQVAKYFIQEGSDIIIAAVVKYDAIIVMSLW